MSETDPLVRIVPLELRVAEVVGRLLPSQMQMDKPVAWVVQAMSRGDVPDLQFHGAQGRVLTLQLLFDGSATGASVQPDLDRLSRLAEMMADGPGASGAKQRPQRVAVRWPANKVAEFRGVIDSLSIQYAEFLANGTPVRATATVRIREAAKLKVGKSP